MYKEKNRSTIQQNSDIQRPTNVVHTKMENTLLFHFIFPLCKLLPYSMWLTIPPPLDRLRQIFPKVSANLSEGHA
jgi:hypothetical protein